MDLTVKSEAFGNQDYTWLGSARGTESPQSCTLDTSAFTEGTHYPNGYFPSGLPLARLGSGLYGPAGGTSEVQTVTITGTPTGGTFTLSFDGGTTAGIAFNANAAAVQAALEALPSINAGDVTVTGGPGPGTPYVVTFGGQYAGDNVAQMTASAASLTGGTSPAVTVTTTTAGGGDGLGDLAGFLLHAIPAPSSTSVDVQGALLDTGRIVTARLPVAISAGVRASNPRFVFVS